MLRYIRTIDGKILETEYEDFELDYACSEMSESFWNGEHSNQAILDDDNKIIYVMSDNQKNINLFPEYEVILAEDVNESIEDYG
jgi:hypothetical protein